MGGKSQKRWKWGCDYGPLGEAHLFGNGKRKKGGNGGQDKGKMRGLTKTAWTKARKGQKPMATVRSKHRGGFNQINKQGMQKKGLSWGAKGREREEKNCPKTGRIVGLGTEF